MYPVLSLKIDKLQIGRLDTCKIKYLNKEVVLHVHA